MKKIKLPRPTNFTRAVFFTISDAIIFFISFYLSYQLRFNFNVPEVYIESFYALVWYLIAIKILFLYIFKIYFVTWRYFVLTDMQKILYAFFISYMVFIVFIKISYGGVFPRSAILIDFLISFFLIGALRFSKRIITDFKGDM